MSGTVLVFGISGFTGKYLAEEFYKYGYAIYGCDLFKSENLPDYVNFMECDLLDGVRTANIIRTVRPTHIINLAAISSVGYSWTEPVKTITVNVEGTVNIFEAVRQYGEDTKILVIGSSEEYSNSDEPISEDFPLDASNPYGLSKATQESFAKIYREHYGMKIYCVRSFNYIGVGQTERFVIPSWCKQTAQISLGGKSGSIKVGNIDVKRDFSDVRDVVRAYRMIMESDDCRQVYNIGSGNAVLLSDLLDYIISLSSCSINIKIDESLLRPTDNRIICCCNKLIKQNIGWYPQYNIYNTILDMYEFYYKKLST